MAHVPVMVTEVLRFLEPAPGLNFIDCTLGDGGHSREILEKTAPDGRVLGFDLDPEAIATVKNALAAYGDRLIPVNASYTELATVVERERFGPVSGVLMDFGFSSAQLSDRGRGFSFEKDEPLDMRYSGGAAVGGGQELTAAEIVNSWPKSEIAHVLAEYGEERFSLDIAEALVTARRKARIIGTRQLVGIVAGAVPANYEQGRINPATRTFQALRIAVNDELGSIERVLPQALAATGPDGVIVSIAFHSLEDRIVKTFLKGQAEAGAIELLTPKPLIPSEQEIARNSRSRSAKLRAARKK